MIEKYIPQKPQKPKIVVVREGNISGTDYSVFCMLIFVGIPIIGVIVNIILIVALMFGFK